MIGIAAGLTIGGKIQFTELCNFSTGGILINQSVAYSEKNSKIYASYAGLTR
jgi:transketolase C-terminal domain/subunit